MSEHVEPKPAMEPPPGRINRAARWVADHFVNICTAVVCLVVATYFVRVMVTGR